MGVPVSQMWTVAKYVLGQKLRGRRHRYPLVLMLEPLFRCDLACAGCGNLSKNDRPIEACPSRSSPVMRRDRGFHCTIRGDWPMTE